MLKTSADRFTPMRLLPNDFGQPFTPRREIHEQLIQLRFIPLNLLLQFNPPGSEPVLFQQPIRHPNLWREERIRLQIERFAFAGQVRKLAAPHRLFNLFVNVDRHFFVLAQSV